MKTSKKILAGALACTTLAGSAVALSGCGSNNGSGTWVVKSDTASISSGVYHYCLFYAYQNAMYSVADYTQPILSQTVKNDAGEEVPASEYIKEEAMHYMLPYLVAEEKMAELKLSLDDVTRFNAKESAATDWESYGAMLEGYGITQSDLQYVSYDYSAKYSKIFEALYGAGGEREVALEDMKEYLLNNYSNIEYLVVSTTKDDGTVMEDKEIKQLVKDFKSYAKTYGDKTLAEIEEQYRADYGLETATEETVEDTEAAETTETTDADGHNHDHSHDDDLHYKLVGELKSFPEEFQTAVNKMKAGECKALDLSDTGYVLLVAKEDIKDAEQSYFDTESESYEENIFNVLVSMKSEEYTEEMQKLAEEYDTSKLTFNDSAYDVDLVAMFEPESLESETASAVEETTGDDADASNAQSEAETGSSDEDDNQETIATEE